MTHANRFSGRTVTFAGARAAYAMLLLLVLASVAAASTDQTRVRRYLLSAGANNGGTDRVLLRYAVSDARAFATVLTEMGGVERNNAFILANPSGGEIMGGILHLNKLIAKDRANERDIKTEVFVYYSGHADADGLKLGGETLSWADFRSAVNGIDADVRVAVLDACGSGAITRTKGGVAKPAFLSDASSNMKGYAFLTSSNENEASQESDRIRGSYFTHALLSGMRGAADLTGDGRVTINEAYQYAFNETLHSTQNTTAGTQHPSRDMNLAGTGDIVMTDLRETNAILSLGDDIEGRFFIRDEQGNLFAELRKMRGRTIELGITPGKYTVQMQAPSRWWTANNVVIAEGRRTALTMNDMSAVQPKRTVARGGGEGLNDGSENDDDTDIFEDDYTDNGGADSLAPGPADLRDSLESTADAPPSLSADSSLSTPPAPDTLESEPAVKFVVNPMLDSACRAPRRTNAGFFYAGSGKPDNGLQLSLLVNDARAEFCGTQVSLFLNSARTDMNGAQITPGINFSTGSGDLSQVGSINLAAQNIDGAQVGAINLARFRVSYAQAGVINFAESVGYVQAGMINIADNVEYVQLGALNFADDAGRAQVGAVNIAGTIGRVQVGAANIAGAVERPIGILNIAGHSEKVPIGLLNIIGNGIFDATFYVEMSKKTSSDMSLSLRTGTPWLYTTFEYSQQTGGVDTRPKPKHIGAGIGTRFGMTTQLSANLDFIGATVYDLNRHSTTLDFPQTNVHHQDYNYEDESRFCAYLLKPRVGFNATLSPFFGVTAGMSLNTLFEDARRTQVWPTFHMGVTMGRINPPSSPKFAGSQIDL